MFQIEKCCPRTITVDKNAAYPKAVIEMKRDKRLWRFAKLRQVKYPNNIVEIDQTWCLFKSKCFREREDTDELRFAMYFGELSSDRVQRDRQRSPTSAYQHSCRAFL